MSTDQTVRMFDDEPPLETEQEEAEEELLGRYLQIGDVAKSIGVNPSVLRFWEQEFPQLRPTKRGNRRYYSSDDVELIRTIQHLLYEEHYTIIGARNKIHELVCRDKVDTFMDQNVPTKPLSQELKASQAQAALLKETLQALDFNELLIKLKAIRGVLTGEASKEEPTVQDESSSTPSEPEQTVMSFAFDLDSAANTATTPDQVEAVAATIQPTVSFAQETTSVSTVLTSLNDQPAPVSEAQQQKPLVPATDSVPATPQQAMKPEVSAPSASSAPTTASTQAQKKTSRLPIPPLPSQQRAFTIGMTVSPQMKKDLFWKR